MPQMTGTNPSRGRERRSEEVVWHVTRKLITESVGSCSKAILKGETWMGLIGREPAIILSPCRDHWRGTRGILARLPPVRFSLPLQGPYHILDQDTLFLLAAECSAAHVHTTLPNATRTSPDHGEGAG